MRAGKKEKKRKIETWKNTKTKSVDVCRATRETFFKNENFDGAAICQIDAILF